MYRFVKETVQQAYILSENTKNCSKPFKGRYLTCRKEKKKAFEKENTRLIKIKPHYYLFNDQSTRIE